MDANNIQVALGGRFLIANYVYMAVCVHPDSVPEPERDRQSARRGRTARPVRSPTFQQDGNGSYTQWVGVVDVNLEKQF